MATTKPISGNAEKNDGGTILNAGNIAGNRITNLAVTTTCYRKADDFRSISSATANIGTTKPISGGKFNDMEKGEYVILGVQDRLAQTDFTTLRNPSSRYNTVDAQLFNQYERYNITSWNYLGVATKGGNAGTAVVASGINNVTGRMTDHGARSPGELQFQYGASTPGQYDMGK